MASINVTPGFRFVPTAEELLVYLFSKVHGFPLPSSSAIPEVDVYGCHPCCLAAGDHEEKFYFVKMKRNSKNKNGKRPSRIQDGHAYAYDDGPIGIGGWWKAATGMKDICSEEGGNHKHTNLGFKRTLKFYSFKNKNKEQSEATGTDWIMHEYNLNNIEFQEWVICGIKYKGKKSKAVGGTTGGEYLDDSCAALTTTTTTTTTTVPLGYRFVPTDEELMKYLFNKVDGLPLPSSSVIPEVDVYCYQPCFLCAGDHGEEKFYFVKMKRLSKNKTAKRPSRIQEGHTYASHHGTIGVGGWWKATTSMKNIYTEEGGNRKHTNLGFKRTLKFYSFKNKNKERSEATGTDWIMHEYSLNNTEFQEWVICGIKYNGEKGKAVGGTSRGEYLDDSCAALTTTTTTLVETMLLAPNQDQVLRIQAGGGKEEDLVRTQEKEGLTANINEPLYEEDQDLNPLHHLEVNSLVETMLLAPNQDQDVTIQAGGGTRKYEEEEDLVRTQEEEELMANINEFLHEEDHDLNPLHHLEVNSNNISIIEDDQNSSKVLASEKEDIGNLNSHVVERHKHDEFMMSDIYGFVNHGYHDQQTLQHVQPLEIIARINEDSQNLSKRVFDNKDIQNWISSVVTGIEQNEKAVLSWEHDDWLKSLHAFVGYDPNLSYDQYLSYLLPNETVHH